MPRSVRDRLNDIEKRIGQIERLMAGRSRQAFETDFIAVAALEQFLEIISEASRHIPEDLKRQHSHIPWRQVADIGNWLRHVDQQVTSIFCGPSTRKISVPFGQRSGPMMDAVEQGASEA